MIIIILLLLLPSDCFTRPKQTRMTLFGFLGLEKQEHLIFTPVRDGLVVSRYPKGLLPLIPPPDKNDDVGNHSVIFWGREFPWSKPHVRTFQIIKVQV